MDGHFQSHIPLPPLYSTTYEAKKKREKKKKKAHLDLISCGNSYLSNHAYEKSWNIQAKYTQSAEILKQISHHIGSSKR